MNELRITTSMGEIPGKHTARHTVSQRYIQTLTTIAGILLPENICVIQTPEAKLGPAGSHIDDRWDAPLVQMLGSFDLERTESINYCCVRSARRENGEYETTIELGIRYNHNEVVLVFENVQRAQLPEVSRLGLQFGEPFIENLEGCGLEYVRYRLTDELEGWFIESENLVASIVSFPRSAWE